VRHMLRRPLPLRGDRPLTIAHRGARAHARENTLAAFRAAAELGSDMWELDLRLTADGVPVVSHDAATGRVHGADLDIGATSFARLRAAVPDLPSLAEVVALARELRQGLYVELKERGAGAAALPFLERVPCAVLGSFLVEEIAQLSRAGCPLPLAILVRRDEDPLRLAQRSGADIVHPCWEAAGARPQDLLTPELLRRIREADLGLVLWHEERPEILAELVHLPALGICTDQPELLGGFRARRPTGIGIVAHRGVNHLAPENTLPAMQLAYDLGCDWLELDVRETRDGALVVIHDATLERTTDGQGAVAAHSLAELRRLDAGSWKHPDFRGVPIPTLQEAIRLCQAQDRQMYIEIKSADPARIWALVEATGFTDRCFFWARDVMLMQRLRHLAPRARIKANPGQFGGFDAMCAAIAPQIVEIGHEHWHVLAPQARARGITPMLQYFGTDPGVFASILELRPEMANLDRIDLLLRAARARH